MPSSIPSNTACAHACTCLRVRLHVYVCTHAHLHGWLLLLSRDMHANAPLHFVPNTLCAHVCMHVPVGWCMRTHAYAHALPPPWPT